MLVVDVEIIGSWCFVYREVLRYGFGFELESQV
jgi:hypothetical protein